MLKKLPVLFLAYFIIANFCGCASISGPITQTQKEQKLICSVSYVQALVMVKGALKTESIQFEKAIITKDTAKLKGIYSDGRIIQIVISRMGNSESSVAVDVGASQGGREAVQDILEAIIEYSKRGRK